MFHLTYKGLLGRKKESSLLMIVLVLSFLLSSALAIILPSTQAEAQLQREKIYGSWKVMLLERDADTCAQLSQSLAGQGIPCAALSSVSLSSDGELISVMTPEAMELGNFELLDGRLPEAEDEILLVENQFSASGLPAVGERIIIRYSWTAGAKDADQFARQQEKLVQDAYARGVALIKEKYLDRYHAFLADAAANMANDEFSRYVYMNLTRDCLGVNEPVAPEDMTPEQLDASISTYIRLYSSALLSDKIITTNEPVLIPCEDFYFTAIHSVTKQTLAGECYAELDGQTIQLTNDYTEVSANIPYTVCGILKSYEATWNSGGHDLPDAFLAPAGQEKINRSIAYAEEQVTDLRFYYDEAQRTATLLVGGEASAAALYTALAGEEQALESPFWEQMVYHEPTPDGNVERVRFHGWDPAENCDAFREGYVTYDESGSESYVFPDIPGEDGQPFSYTAEELQADDFQFPGLEKIPAAVEYPPLEEQYEKNEYYTRINTYAFPRESGSSGISSAVLNWILVLISACAVLVICVVQSKQRARSIVTLRAIGLKAGQAAVMQLTEAVVFLLASLLIGLPLGYLAANAALHWFYHAAVLAFDAVFLLRSLIFAALSLLLGLQLPLLYALQLPLTGKASIAVRKAPKRAALRRGTLLEMERAAARFNRRRNLLARMLCALALLLALLTLVLSHFSFDTYRNIVGRSNMPDYTLSAPFGMKPRHLREKLEQYAASDALDAPPAHLDAYVAAENVTLSGYENSPVLSALSHMVRIAGMKEDSRILQELLSRTGPIDTEKLLSGEGCILLMPYYRTAHDGVMRYSADSVDAYRYTADDSIRPGDVLTLSAETHTVTEFGVLKETNTASVEVLAVLHEYSGVWLFDSGSTPGVLVSGQPLVTAVYPNAAQSYTPEQIKWVTSSNIMHCSYCRGATYFQFYAQDTDDHTASCWNLAEAEGLNMKNYYREKLDRHTACLNQQVMTVLLGAAAVLLVLIILLFILSDMAEQERRRTGILRALGASKRAIRRTHWLLAMREGLWTVVLANAAVVLVLLCCALFETGFHTLSPAALFTTLAKGLLWQYPWLWHLVICAAAWALTSLLRVLPYRRLCKSSVIATIKGLERGE